MIALEAVDRENFWSVVELETAPEQRDFVTSNAVSIAQAYAQPECVPLVVASDGEPVGFAMYCLDHDDGEYWIYRLMIDKAHQRKGYGEAALGLLLERIRREGGRRVHLGVHADAEAAIRLYRKFGFEFDGQAFGQERIMRLDDCAGEK